MRHLTQIAPGLETKNALEVLPNFSLNAEIYRSPNSVFLFAIYATAQTRLRARYGVLHLPTRTGTR